MGFFGHARKGLICLKKMESCIYEVSNSSETARQKSMSKSALIRDALEAYLRTDDAVGKDSALAHAADIRGMLSGPADLSVNRKYLQNFGR